MLRAPEPGSATSDGTLALVVGVVPFALGLVLGLMAIASERRGAV
jgi:hypothetical protein